MDLMELGGHIQRLRAERGLTLQDLAETAQVSVSMLSSVERGQKAPTIVTLARIAQGLTVPLAELVTAADDTRIIVRRAADQDVADEPGGWRRTVLSPVVPGVNFELIRTTLPAGCDAGRFPAYAAGSHEYVAVEAGRLRLTIRDQPLELNTGDSVYFAADTVHDYANTTSSPCTYYVAALIMRPRTASRRAVRPAEPPVS